jgi:alpha-tubulin suppressor-like RCC1 family protein
MTHLQHVVPRRWGRRSLVRAARSFAQGGAIAVASLALAGCDNERAEPAVAVTVAPTALSVGQGLSSDVAVTIARSGGLNGPVQLAVTGVPAGVTVDVSPAQVPEAGTTGTIRVTAGAGAAPGQYTVVVRATAASATPREAPLALTVTARGFRLALEPLSTPPGSVAGREAFFGATVTVGRVGGYDAPVDLAVSGLPAGVEAVFSRRRLAGSDSTSALTLVRVASAPRPAPGSYTVTVRGTTADASEQVVTSPSFAVAPPQVRTLVVRDGDQQGADAGAAVPVRPTVLALDAWGERMPGAEVTFRVAGGSGQVDGGVQTTDADGLAAAGRWTVGAAPGPNRLEATAGGRTAVFTAVGVDRAPVGGFRLTGIASSGTGVHTCGWSAEGAAYCWGLNFWEQLGDGTDEDYRETPVRVRTSLPLSALTTGVSHTCGLASDGAAYCWGANGFGAVGVGRPVTYHVFSTPVAVTGGLRFSAIAAGAAHACGVAQPSGAAYCWGMNDESQVGDGSTTNRGAPTRVAADLAFTAVGGGDSFSCGLTRAGAAYCWGANDARQLGDSTAVDRTTPVEVRVGQVFQSLAVGARHTCGLTRDGVPYCWGALGYPERVPLPDGQTFVSLTAGGGHTCGLTAGGRAYCWGSNGNGQLGDGTTGHRTRPTPVTGGLAFTALGAGGMHTCGVAAGVAYCWGSGPLGMGTDDRTVVPSPRPVHAP